MREPYEGDAIGGAALGEAALGRVETPPRFVWPLAGPFGAVVLGVIAVMSLV